MPSGSEERKSHRKSFCTSIMMFSMTLGVASQMRNWVMVGSYWSSAMAVFTDGSGCLRMPQRSIGAPSLRCLVQHHVLTNCFVLTLSQRFADWFVLRRFCLSGTTAEIIVSRNAHISQRLGGSRCTLKLTPKGFLRMLCNSWFSTLRSTEAMMRGTLNESNVLLDMRTWK